MDEIFHSEEALVGERLSVVRLRGPLADSHHLGRGGQESVPRDVGELLAQRSKHRIGVYFCALEDFLRKLAGLGEGRRLVLILARSALLHRFVKV